MRTQGLIKGKTKSNECFDLRNKKNFLEMFLPKMSYDRLSYLYCKCYNFLIWGWKMAVQSFCEHPFMSFNKQKSIRCLLKTSLHLHRFTGIVFLSSVCQPKLLQATAKTCLRFQNGWHRTTLLVLGWRFGGNALFYLPFWESGEKVGYTGLGLWFGKAIYGSCMQIANVSCMQIANNGNIIFDKCLLLRHCRWKSCRCDVSFD